MAIGWSERFREELHKHERPYFSACVSAGVTYAAICWLAERYIPGWPVWVELEVVGGVLLVWLLVRGFVQTFHAIMTANEVVRLFLYTFVAVGLPITIWQVARALL